MKYLIFSLIFFLSVVAVFNKQNNHRKTLPLKLLQTLRLFSPECNYHGVFYDRLCYCYTDFNGLQCQEKIVPGWFDTDDKCDNLLARVDSLMNISPTNYEIDDDEFPRLTGNSIGSGQAAYGEKGSTWIRMHDMTDTFNIFSGEITVGDVKQGALGDCYLLAAMICLTNIRQGEQIKKAFITKTDNDKHVYITRWLLDGKPRFVAVDDWVPGSNGKSSFSHQTDKNAFWPMIVEKSWSKIHGSFMRTESGQSADIWRSLTQAPTYWKNINTFTAANLFATLQGFFANEFAVGISSPGKGYTHDVDGHAFSMLGAHKVTLDSGSTVNLIRMMNPWHSDEWSTNPWADDSSKWTQRVKNQVPWVNSKEDGIYYVEISDFMNNYQSISWAEIRKGYGAAFEDVSFKPSVSNYETQFTLKNGGGNTIYVAIDEPDKRILLEGCTLPFKVNSIQVKSQNGKVFYAENDNTVRIDNAGDGTYTVQVSINNLKSYSKYFTISTYNPVDTITFSPISNNQIIYNKLRCPNGCSSHGRCNAFNGQCSCIEGYKGTDCSTKVVKPCPSNCNGANGVCDSGTGTCSCKPGFFKENCVACANVGRDVDCVFWADKGNCASVSVYLNQMTEQCQRTCGQRGYKIGFPNCYLNPDLNPCVKSKFCNGNGSCNAQNGACTCNRGFGGNNCDTQTCKDVYSNCATLAQTRGLCSLSPSNINLAIAKACALSCNLC